MTNKQSVWKVLGLSVLLLGSMSFIGLALADAGAPALEANISCPHSSPGARGVKIIGKDPVLTTEAIEAICTAVNVPVIVKLSPNVTDIVDIAGAALDGGAGGISAINTLEALEVDVHFCRPSLGNLVGGQSGPSIRCVAQRKVAEILLAIVPALMNYRKARRAKKVTFKNAPLNNYHLR